MRAFGRGSPVLDYWLVHSEGFELTTPGGGRRGVVQEVVIDELGNPRALVVRSGVLHRPRVMNVNAVEAVVPAEGTITLLDERRKRTPPRNVPRRRDTGPGLTARFAHAAAKGARRLRLTAVLVLTYFVSAVRCTARGLRRNVPVTVGRIGRAGASAAAWARPHGRTLVRVMGSAAVTVGLLVLTLVYGIVVALVGGAGLLAREWTRRRSSPASGRATPFS